MKVRFAVSPGASGSDPERLASLVAGAERRGFDSLWFPDLPLWNIVDPTLAVAFAAGLSHRLKLGVDLIPFGREPFVVARQLAELDQLTGGRLLVTFVPGVDLPGERAALGLAGRHRGRLLDSLVPELRRWWSGSVVTVGEGDTSAGVSLPVLPRQAPLEVWLGGHGPQAIRRAGRLADGWLGSGRTLDPGTAGEVCRQIQDEAASVGRRIDPEHFGLSLRYARNAGDLRSAGTPASTAGGQEPPVGAGALRQLVQALVDQGISKFVVSPVAPVDSWPDELDWLAGAILDLQS